MSFPNRDAQILAHILEYCNRIEKTLSRFGKEFDVFWKIRTTWILSA